VQKEGAVATCEVCGNDYDKTFEIIVARESKHHVFDSFECAIQALAPRCAHCGCRVIGHGVEGGGLIFCCASCAKRAGIGGVADRAPEEASAAGPVTARPPSES
jgi:hypothetical protein